MKKFVLGAIASTALLITPAAASAEWIFTPFIGSSFAAGVDDDSVNDVIDRAKLTWGGSATWLGGGALGFEVDFGYAPEFFEGNDGDVDFIDSSNYSSLMANVILSVPRGPFRPYVTGGVGLMNTSIDDVDDAFDVDSNELGFNVGAGVFAFFSDRIGIRGDLRYLRQMNTGNDGEDDDDLDFNLGALRLWRGTVGVSFRF